MKDLKEISGLDIKLEDIGLSYDQNQYPAEPKPRTYIEARDVYLEKEAEEQDLYLMYRYFEDVKDAEKFTSADAEYDLTLIYPGKIGKEFVKTAGHYHDYVPNTDMAYPELYEVIEGEVEYLIQTKPDSDNNVDVVIISAGIGDKVIIPPNYGHISINVGANVAISANLQKRGLPETADYETFKVSNGGALYRTDTDWENNNNFKIRSLKKVQPKERPDWGLVKGKPLYTAFIETPDKFKWLIEPQYYDFSDIWEEIK